MKKTRNSSRANVQFLTQSLAARSNNQHSNTLNQSSSSLLSNRLNENSHNTNQLVSQEQQDPPIARPCSSQL